MHYVIKSSYLYHALCNKTNYPDHGLCNQTSYPDHFHWVLTNLSMEIPPRIQSHE